MMFVDVIFPDGCELVAPDLNEDVEDVEAYIAFVEDHDLVCTENKVIGDLLYLTFEERR